MLLARGRTLFEARKYPQRIADLEAKSREWQEYRRHVTMTCKVEGQDVEVTIDNITQYYKEIKEALAYIEKYLRGNP